jgi:hypothetical protein
VKDLPKRIIEGVERIPAGLLALVRTWQGWVILVIVFSQLAIPVHYYVRHRDPHDERFAWRMFSPMRMTKCTPQFTVNDQPVNLSLEFHEAWLEMAKRGRFNVVEAMGARLCEKHPGAAVHGLLECQYIDRPKATWGGYDMCKVPQL